MGKALPWSSDGKEICLQCGRPRFDPWVRSPGEDPQEKGMATHSSILAWRIPWTEEPGGLQSMGSLSWTQLSDCLGKRVRLPVQEMAVRSLGQEDPLEEAMAAYSSVLAWRIPWTEAW